MSLARSTGRSSCENSDQGKIEPVTRECPDGSESVIRVASRTNSIRSGRLNSVSNPVAKRSAELICPADLEAIAGCLGNRGESLDHPRRHVFPKWNSFEWFNFDRHYDLKPEADPNSRFRATAVGMLFHAVRAAGYWLFRAQAGLTRMAIRLRSNSSGDVLHNQPRRRQTAANAIINGLFAGNPSLTRDSSLSCWLFCIWRKSRLPSHVSD